MNAITEFRTWMQHHGVAAASARVYAATISAELNRVPSGVNSTDHLHNVGEAKSSFRTAYRWFVQWKRENGEIWPELPALPAGRPLKQRSNSAFAELPPEETLATIAAFLKRGWTERQLRNTVWAHLRHNQAKNRYELPQMAGREVVWTLMSEEDVEALRKWAKPEAGWEAQTPLIPHAPGSRHHINWRWLMPFIAARM